MKNIRPRLARLMLLAVIMLTFAPFEAVQAAPPATTTFAVS